MRNLTIILIVIGIVLGSMSGVIPFSGMLTKSNAFIAYNRGMLLGFALISIGLYLHFRKIKYIGALFLGLFGGLAGELMVSTYNLLCGECIRTYYYFLIIFICFSVDLLIFFILILKSRLCQKSKK